MSRPALVGWTNQLKLRILVLVLAAGLLGASVADAESGGPVPGKAGTRPPKPSKPTRPNCGSRVTVILSGTLANNPAAGDTSFRLYATRANRHGRAYLSAPRPLRVKVTAATTYLRKAPRSAPTKTLASLAVGDLVTVRARACRARLRNGGTPTLTARHVEARSLS